VTGRLDDPTKNALLRRRSATRNHREGSPAGDRGARA
jgi:hypothetical protein